MTEILPQLFCRRHILALSKLEAFADDKFNVTQNIKFVFRGVDKIVKTGEHASISIFSFSHDVFKRPFPYGCEKLSLYGKCSMSTPIRRGDQC